jgi:Cd2+/Zn2+-exporting ATPase
MAKQKHKTNCAHCDDLNKKPSQGSPRQEVFSLFGGNKRVLTTVSGVSFLIGLILTWVFGQKDIATWFYYLSIATGGYFVLQDALKGLFNQRFLNINFLVTVAALGAIYINQLAEAAAVVFFFSLAEMFEEFGIERSKRALEALLKKSPQDAVLKNGKIISVEQVKVNDVVIVRPGDLVPLDGVVIKGSSAVDEATITGESVPKDKLKGDTVFASTLNQNGYLEIKVTKTSRDSTFTKIVKLVEQAQASRAPAQEFIDRFAKYYTPSVVAAAVLITIIPPLFFGADFTEWLYRALVLLVIACPCALVISTPVSIASAIGGASKKGVLIKGGRFLEALSKIKAVAFDKTRTLTLGKPYISDVVTFNGFSEEEVLADAAGIEKFSSHPLAKAVLDFTQERGITPHTMDKFQNVAGKGGKATCLVCSDIEHCVGNLKLIGANSVATKEILQKTEKLEKEGKTVVLISEGKQVMGALAISDKIRPQAKQTIDRLKNLSIRSVMLTGDNQHAADYVAKTLGLNKVFASLLPDEKLTKVEELKQKFGAVAMVGDGVNDAPSLATATVGIAIATDGADVAIETADIALMNNNLLNIPYSLSLGKKTMATIKQNITAALGVKAVFLLLAVFGFTHLEYAIGADSGVAILVILNSLRLFHFEKGSDNL